MAKALDELWNGWAHGGGGGVLAAALVVLGVIWIAVAARTFLEARRAWRPPMVVTAAVVAVPLLVAAVGIAQPSEFQWWALLGLGSAPILALLCGFVFRRSTTECPQAHVTVTTWSFCPWCPSPLAAVALASPIVVHPRYVGRGIGTLLRRASPEPVLPAPPAISAPDVRSVLVWLIPEGRGRSEVAVRQPGVVVGRNPAAEIHIDDPTVSWEHARIVNREGSPALIDLASSNGTYLNGERVDDSFLLTDDRVQFGGVVFRVRRS